MTTVVQTLPSWLSRVRMEDGLFHISEAKRFAHDEAKYDVQYGNEAGDMQVGRGIVNLLKESGAPFDGPALEVGCGTGLATAGLVASGEYPLVVATDSSLAFLKITREKLKAQGLMSERVALAVMQGEEIDRIPEGSFSLILLRSTLHHILHPKKFLRAAAKVLVPGGVLTCEEPCLEGYLMMGTIMQFFPVVAKSAGVELTAEQLAKVDVFVRSMQFYTRRDVDKSQAEDKHLFRVDEIMEVGAECGLSVKCHPNVGYRYFSVPEAERAGGRGPEAEARRAQNRQQEAVTGLREQGWFRKFTRNYVRECMGSYCDYVDESSRGGRVPYLNGTFVCRKVG